VVAVDVGVHAKQSSDNGSYSVLECPRERHTYDQVSRAEKGMTGGDTDGIREDCLIIKDALGPIHERVDILGRGELCRTLVAYTIFPEVFISNLSGSIVVNDD
jgi:hypothetical protein